MIINTDELRAFFLDNPKSHDLLTIEHFIRRIEKLQIEMMRETNRDQK